MVYSRNKELTKNQILETKGIAILFMLLLHLFSYIINRIEKIIVIKLEKGEKV